MSVHTRQAEVVFEKQLGYRPIHLFIYGPHIRGDSSRSPAIQRGHAPMSRMSCGEGQGQIGAFGHPDGLQDLP